MLRASLSMVRDGKVIPVEVHASVEEKVINWSRILGIRRGDLLKLAIDFFNAPGEDVQLTEHLIVRYMNRLEVGYRPSEEVLRKMGEE